jgi:CMP-N-acetylneuraminic acid synthetase
VPFKRPVELAQDNLPGIEPVLDAIKKLPNYDYVVLLQPTSPLRTVEDKDGCIEKCIYNNVNVCVSITEPNKSPYWMYNLDDKDKWDGQSLR